MDRSQLRRGSLAAGIVAASVGAVAAAVALVFREEGKAAQEHIGHRLGDAGPDADGLYHPEYGNLLCLLVAGDSVADGLGATAPEATLGAMLANALAQHAHRSVQLHTVAVVGARTSDISAQLDSLAQNFLPDVTVMVVGANDLTGRVPLAESVRELREVIERLIDMGSSVVFGTCPDFDTLPSLPQPLREVGGQMSRRLAAAQFKAAAAAGAHPVMLGRAVRQGDLWASANMFAVDGFHPSNTGYRSAALAMAPALLVAYDGGCPAPCDPATAVPPLRSGTD